MEGKASQMAWNGIGKGMEWGEVGQSKWKQKTGKFIKYVYMFHWGKRVKVMVSLRAMESSSACGGCNNEFSFHYFHRIDCPKYCTAQVRG